MTARPPYRLVGTTDDVVDCARCGKPDLRMTVILEFLDDDGQGGLIPSGEVTYFGSTCATRALAERGVRVTPTRIREQAKAAQRLRVALAADSLRNLDFYGIGIDEDLTETRIAEVLPRWREINVIAGGRLRPLDEARRMFLDCVERHQANVTALTSPVPADVFVPVA